MAGVPFKLCIPSRALQVGVVAKNFDHFLDVIRDKFGYARGSFQLSLDDGTLICDQDYFELLEPQTKLTIAESNSLPAKQLGEKRPLADVHSPPPLKRPRPAGSGTTRSPPPLQCVSGGASPTALAACLQIDHGSAVGSVKMHPSPTSSPTSSSPTPHTASGGVQHVLHTAAHVPENLQRTPGPTYIAPSGLRLAPHYTQSHSLQQRDYVQTNSNPQLCSPPPMHYFQLQPHQPTPVRPTPLTYFPNPASHQPLIAVAQGLQASNAVRVHQRQPLTAPIPINQYLSLPGTQPLKHRSLPLLRLREHQRLGKSVHPTTMQILPSVRSSHQSGPPSAVISHGIHLNPQAIQHQCQQLQVQPRGLTTHVPPTHVTDGEHRIEMGIQFPGSKQQVPPSSVSEVGRYPVSSGDVSVPSLTRVSVVDAEKEPLDGEETEDEDAGLRLSIVESESESSTPTATDSQTSSPAFSTLSNSATPLPRPSSVTLHPLIQSNERRGQNADNAIIIEEDESEEESTEEFMEAVDQGKDFSPDDGYCSSSPPGSATEKLPFADFDFPKCTTQAAETESQRKKDDSLLKAESVDDGSSPEKAALPPSELKVSIPVERHNRKIVCKGYVSELNISVPVSITRDGGIVCQQLQVAQEAAEEKDNEVDLYSTVELTTELPVSIIHDGGIVCQRPQVAKEDAEKKMDDEVDLHSTVESPTQFPPLALDPESEAEEDIEVEDPVIVQEHASEELIRAVTHMCTEAILRECVEEIVALAQKARQQQLVKVAEYLPLVVEEETVILEEGEGDIVNEVIVSDSEDGELSTADLIKREMEQSSAEAYKSKPLLQPEIKNIKQDKVSERIENVLFLAEQLSPEESKVIRDFFNGESSFSLSRGRECFVLKKMDCKQVNLELDFRTGEWKGYISAKT